MKKTSGIAEVLRRALEPLGARITAAFIYGSIARGDERQGSDLDLMIVGEVKLGEVVEGLQVRSSSALCRTRRSSSLAAPMTLENLLRIGRVKALAASEIRRHRSDPNPAARHPARHSQQGRLIRAIPFPMPSRSRRWTKPDGSSLESRSGLRPIVPSSRRPARCHSRVGGNPVQESKLFGKWLTRVLLGCPLLEGGVLLIRQIW